MELREACSPQLNQVIETLASLGAKVYFVGGCVRDALLGLPIKDFDIEIYHLNAKQLEDCLSQFGHCCLMGKSFGVYKIYEIPEADFALPRKEKKIAEGHQGFEIEIDIDASLATAAKRRDLTVNAIYYDALNHTYLDPYHGIEDLKKGILRVVDSQHFAEDPLRVLRLAQFLSRLDFEVDKQSQAICHRLVQEKALETLSKERIAQEYDKMLLGKKPSKGLTFLMDIHALPNIFEQLAQTHQRADYHLEGSAWIHTLCVVDEASLVKDQTDNPLGFMYSALLHDIGKPLTTDAFGHAYGHEEVGSAMVKDVLNQITNRKDFISYCEMMVACHMKLMIYARNKAKDKTFLKLLWKIDGKTTLNDLYYLTRCDSLGRGIDSTLSLQALDAYLKDKVERLGSKAPLPLVSGKDLLALGELPGPNMKARLNEAYLLQLSGLDKTTILKQLRRGIKDGTRKPRH